MLPLVRTPRKPREVVLQVLYQDDLNPPAEPADPAGAELFLRKRLNEDAALVAFASALLAGVRQKREELDELLAGRADNWSLGRMAATDRNVLRLGAYEILFTETPERVAINEAVELAKRFGAKQSPQFVNGILDRFLKKARASTVAVPVVELPATATSPAKPAVGSVSAISAIEPAIATTSEFAILAAAAAASAEEPIANPVETAKRHPTAEDFARALHASSQRTGERKFPPFFRTLLKTHANAGLQTAAELADNMGWDGPAVVLARYEDLGKRLGTELHYDPPLYNETGEPLWISVLATTSPGGERTPETTLWELRTEVSAALATLGWE